MEETLPSELQKEIGRAHGLRREYEKLGPSGAFRLGFVDGTIFQAEKAFADWDAAAMCTSLAKLRNLK